MLAPCNSSSSSSSSSVVCHNTSFVVSHVHQDYLHSLLRLLSQTLAQAMPQQMLQPVQPSTTLLLALALARRMTCQHPMQSWTSWQQQLQRWWHLQTLPLPLRPRKGLLRVPRRVARRRPLRPRKGLLPEEEEEEEEEEGEEEEEVHTQ